MARKMTEWPSKRGPITKIMPSDGCIGDTVPLAVGKWCDFHEFGWYMGNVGQIPTRRRQGRVADLHIHFVGVSARLSSKLSLEQQDEGGVRRDQVGFRFGGHHPRSMVRCVMARIA